MEMIQVQCPLVAVMGTLAAGCDTQWTVQVVSGMRKNSFNTLLGEYYIV